MALTERNILLIVCAHGRLTQKHEDKIDVQHMREADRCANGFRQRNAEEFSLIKDRNGLYYSNSYMR